MSRSRNTEPSSNGLCVLRLKYLLHAQQAAARGTEVVITVFDAK
jgi:hypothetical protein